MKGYYGTETADALVHELPKGLLKWHGFREGSIALQVLQDARAEGILTEALRECGVAVERVGVDGAGGLPGGYYDYALVGPAVGSGKDVRMLTDILGKVRMSLKPGGKLFLVAENRLGIRFFCGDRDPFSGRNFDGIENYRRVGPLDRDSLKGRLYSKAELTGMLGEAGFPYRRFYSVFPDITCPQVLFSEGYTPGEELNIRIFPHYHDPSTVFLEEENLYTSLAENGMLHAMANGFLVECPLDGRFSNASQVTLSMDRGRRHALSTTIREDGKVEKRPMYSEGEPVLAQMADNNGYLKAHGVRMVDAVLDGGSYVMPYVEGVPLVKYFRSLARTDQEEFYRQFDRLWDVAVHSSEKVPYGEVDWEHFNPMWDEEKSEKGQKKIDRGKWRRIVSEAEGGAECLGPVLERGFIDLVLLNGFLVDGEFVFFDQEMYVSQLPARAIMLRNIDFLYHCDSGMMAALPRQALLERYGICDEHLEVYYAHINHFLMKLRNDGLLSDYHKAHRRDDEMLHSNRQRMNYSAEEYQRLFVDIFKGLDNKRLYLFGSGNFARKFLAMYGEDYPVEAVLDNDSSRWGQKLGGIGIAPPSVLEGQDASTYKVIICIKNYTGALKQARGLGAKNIGIYETNMEYARKIKDKVAAPGNAPIATGRKKYHVGYVAGVFDLFHIGHLNLLRNAKGQCDYLIVGVVTDEGVQRDKKTECFIPFGERLEVVRACRYVDKAVGIPLEFCDTRDAYLKFQFDAQFSGSDYADDPGWIGKRQFLREHGAELVFFPYTESTSSTKLKKLIGAKLA